MIGLALAVIVSSGAINPHCTKEMICQSGYTKSVRPPPSYTNALKQAQLEQRGLQDQGDFEEDHFIPLELCGCATCVQNLWPQAWPEARQKDKDETRLHRAVCKGQMTLPEAQDAIRKKWAIKLP